MKNKYSKVEPTILSLKSDSVILLQVSPDYFDAEDLKTLEKYYQERFKGHKVIAVWDNVKITILNKEDF